MIEDNIKNLTIAILVVMLLLCICISYDYADDNITISNNITQKQNLTKCSKINDTYYVLDNNSSTIQVKNSDKIHQKQPIIKYPLITATGKPSCSCGRYYSNRWYTRTYMDYCPHCHRYNVLYNAHKWQARYEQELTCKNCGADYCIVDGHEKYSWSKYYLRKC